MNKSISSKGEYFIDKVAKIHIKDGYHTTNSFPFLAWDIYNTLVYKNMLATDHDKKEIKEYIKSKLYVKNMKELIKRGEYYYAQNNLKKYIEKHFPRKYKKLKSILDSMNILKNQ